MYKNFKKFFALFLVFSLILSFVPVMAEDTESEVGHTFQNDMLFYEILTTPDTVNGTPGTVKVIYSPEYKQLTGEVEIPATVEDNDNKKYEVTEIHYDAFKNCTGLGKVTFASDSKLKTIGSLDGNSKNKGAFQGCTGLREIRIPKSVISIGIATFHCNLDKKNKPTSSLTDVTFEPGSILETIGESAFANCKLLSIIIPDKVTEIGEGAFLDCTKLKDVTFEEGSTLQTIGAEAFWGCEKLKKISIPISVTAIEKGTFEGCEKLVTVDFAPGSNLETIGEYAFSGCTKLESINIPDKVETIGAEAFGFCEKLPKINIPKSVTSIGAEAFYCDPILGIGKSTSILKDVTFAPDSNLETIGEKAFACCMIPSIKIPAKVTEIGEGAFLDCTKLKDVTFEGGTAPKFNVLTLSTPDEINARSVTDEINIPGSFDGIAAEAVAIVPYGRIGEKGKAVEDGKYNPNLHPFFENSPLRLTEAQKPTTTPVVTPTQTNTPTPREEKAVTKIEKVENEAVIASVEGIGTTEFDSKTTLEIKVVTKEIPVQKKENYKTSINEIAKGKELKELYDIKLMLNGIAIQPNGSVKVKIKLSEEQLKIEQKEIVYIDDKGKTEIIGNEIENGYISFTVTHFSNYGIIGKTKEMPKKIVAVTKVPKTGDETPVSLGIISIVVMLTISGMIIMRKKEEE